ncbi:MAG: type IX secretion system protein PorQ [Haliscomenobacter sp.]
MNRLLVLCFCSFSYLVHGQWTGGRSTFSFLGLPASPRVSALGGTIISVADDDINLGAGNPAVLNARMHQQLSFSHSFLAGGVTHGYAAYGHHIKSTQATVQLGVQYIDYGVIEATDIYFQSYGDLRVKENAFVAGVSIPIDERIRAGMNTRFISSSLGTLQSVGVSMDWGLIYQDTAQKLSLAFSARHWGRQLRTYSGVSADREPLPFEMQIGLSKQLRYLPFRMSVVYTNLQRWNVRYDDPNAENDALLFGEVAQEPGAFGINVDNFFRHLLFSGELLIGAKENFRLRLAYNHRQRKELSTRGFGSGAGFSFGAGVKVNRFRLDYGRSIYHLAGGANHIGISTNLQSF